MSAIRSRRRGHVENLDSLLDTMANVTGILVVLLAVTQISVGDAMKRLRAQMAARPELTRESLDLARAEADRLSRALAPVLPRQDELEEQRRARREALAGLRAENAEARARFGAAGESDAATLQQRIEASRRQARSLEVEIGATRAEIAALDAALARAEALPLRREARLPDPRPAPAGASDVVYLVRYGRIFRARATELVTALQRGLQDATGGRWRIGLDNPLFLDRSRVVEHFRRNDIGTHALRWHVLDLGPDQFVGQLEWRSRETGETLADLSRPDAVYRQDLTLFHPQRTYFRYFVWDDSFDTYLEARRLANEAGFSAGWTPFAQHDPFRQDLISPSFVGR
ncbi:MAG TPA: hypothetical protein VIY27_03325, partial [Myxococcota bacterium]